MLGTGTILRHPQIQVLDLGLHRGLLAFCQILVLWLPEYTPFCSRSCCTTSGGSAMGCQLWVCKGPSSKVRRKDKLSFVTNTFKQWFGTRPRSSNFSCESLPHSIRKFNVTTFIMFDVFESKKNQDNPRKHAFDRGGPFMVLITRFFGGWFRSATTMSQHLGILEFFGGGGISARAQLSRLLSNLQPTQA